MGSNVVVGVTLPPSLTGTVRATESKRE
jgi:hypothetical protein